MPQGFRYKIHTKMSQTLQSLVKRGFYKLAGTHRCTTLRRKTHCQMDLLFFFQCVNRHFAEMYHQVIL